MAEDQPDLFPDSQPAHPSAVPAFTITALARELGVSRDSVTAALTDADVAPAGSERGYATYRLRDVVGPLAAFCVDADDGNENELKPHQQLALWRARNEQIKYQTACGQLLRREDVEQDQARFTKIITHCFDTLPDRIERDCGAAPLVLAKIEQLLDAAREELYEAVINDGARMSGPNNPAEALRVVLAGNDAALSRLDELQAELNRLKTSEQQRMRGLSRSIPEMQKQKELANVRTRYAEYQRTHHGKASVNSAKKWIAHKEMLPLKRVWIYLEAIVKESLPSVRVAKSERGQIAS